MPGIHFPEGEGRLYKKISFCDKPELGKSELITAEVCTFKAPYSFH